MAVGRFPAVARLDKARSEGLSLTYVWIETGML